MSSPAQAPVHLLYGVNVYHNDGPWENPDDYQKINGLVRLSSGDRALGRGLTAIANHGDWTASDQRVLQRVHVADSDIDYYYTSRFRGEPA